MSGRHPTRVPAARGADFNAFGYDPEGALAHLASHLYGPSWRPSYTVQQFVGRAEAPRYGAPAPYQEAFLPAGFRARTPPLYYGRPAPPYISPPARYYRNHFAALLFSARLRRAMSAVRRGREAREGLCRTETQDNECDDTESDEGEDAEGEDAEGEDAEGEDAEGEDTVPNA